MPPPVEAGDKELEIWLYCGTMGGWANKNQDLMDSLPLCVLRCICQHHKQQRHALHAIIIFRRHSSIANYVNRLQVVFRYSK